MRYEAQKFEPKDIAMLGRMSSAAGSSLGFFFRHSGRSEPGKFDILLVYAMFVSLEHWLGLNV